MIDELFLHLGGEPERWFDERKQLESLPNTLNEIKDLLDKEFGAGVQRVCRLTKGDLPGYIKQFEEVLKIFPADEEKKIRLFKNGLDGKFYPFVAGAQFKTYQEVKTFIQECSARAKEDTPEPVNVFRARESSGGNNGNRGIGQRRPLNQIWTEDEKRLYAEKRCFNCGNLNHQAKHCRAKREKIDESIGLSNLKANGQY